MERIIKKLFLTGCLAVGVAISMMSFSTYAAGGTAVGSQALSGVSQQTSFSINVPNTITISDVTQNLSITATSSVATGTLSAKVTSNTGYKINVKAKEHADLKTSTAGVTDSIAAKAPSAGTNGWAIQDKTNSNAYKAVSTTDATYFTGSAAKTGLKTDFIVGVSVAASLPAGSYSTDLVLTAVANP